MPFVGRFEELQKVVDVISTVISTRGATILISGEAGVGKTRFLEEINDKFHSLGVTVFKTGCRQGNISPFLPFKMIQKIGDIKYSDEKGENQFSMCFDRGDISSEATMFRFYDVISLYAKHCPVVIEIEDLHWADAGSLELFNFISRNISGTRALLIGTYRIEEIGRQKASKDSIVFSDCLRALRNENNVTEIPLHALPEDSTTELISDLLPGAVEENVLSTMMDMCEGNPLFIIETVQWLLSTDQIVMEEGGTWKMRSGFCPETPKSIMDVVQRRLLKLTDEERKIVENASVIGEEFDPRLLAQICEEPVIRILESLESIEKSTMLIEQNKRSFRFEHDMIRKVAYDDMDEERKKESHRRAGNSIEAMDAGEEMYGALSHHFFHGADREKCLAYSMKAGWFCLSRSDAFDGLSFYNRALDILSDGEYDDAPWEEAHEGTADALFILEKYAEAASHYKTIISTSVDKKLIARSYRKLADCIVPGRSPDVGFDNFKEALNRAIGIDEIDPYDIAEVFSDFATMASYQGDRVESDRFFKMSISKFQEIGAWGRLAKELAFYSDLLLTRCETQEAENRLLLALEYVKKEPDPKSELEIRMCLGETAMHLGKYEEARTNLDIASGIGMKLGQSGAACWANYFLALLLDDQNEIEQAMQYAEKCRDLALKTQTSALLSVPCIIMSHIFSRQGKLSEASKLCQDARTILDGYEQRTVMRGMANIVTGEIAFLEGRFLDFRSNYERGIQEFVGCPWEPYYRALGEKWYGSRLSMMNEMESSAIHYLQAIEWYRSIGNRFEVSRIEREMNGWNSLK